MEPRSRHPSVSYARPARPDRGAWWGGFVASVLVHGIVFFAWRGGPPEISDALGADAASRPEARAIHALQLTSAARPADIPRPAAPRIAEFFVELSQPASRAQLRLAALSGAPAPGPDPWSPPATAGSGAPDGTLLPPMPHTILTDWVVPRSAQGTRLTARVWVTSVGKAVGPVELDPPTRDLRFNRRVAERLRRIPYRPALREGEPVPAWAVITFVFCPHGVTATSPPVTSAFLGPACPSPAPEARTSG